MSDNLSETGPCDKCQGSGQLLDRRIGDIECDECQGHGWFNDGVAGPAQDAPHHWVCAIHRGGKCTCSVLDGAAREARVEPIAGPSSEPAKQDKAILPAASASPVEAVEVPDDLLDYMKGIYGFLESIAPAGIAVEAFRLPPSATRAQRAVFDAVSGDARGEHAGPARQDQGDRPEDRGAVGPLVAQPPQAVQEVRLRLGKLRATLIAIETTLDEGELRQAAHDALEDDDALSEKQGLRRAG